MDVNCIYCDELRKPSNFKCLICEAVSFNVCESCCKIEYLCHDCKRRNVSNLKNENIFIRDELFNPLEDDIIDNEYTQNNVFKILNELNDITTHNELSSSAIINEGASCDLSNELSKDTKNSNMFLNKNELMERKYKHPDRDRIILQYDKTPKAGLSICNLLNSNLDYNKESINLALLDLSDDELRIELEKSLKIAKSNTILDNSSSSDSEDSASILKRRPYESVRAYKEPLINNGRISTEHPHYRISYLPIGIPLTNQFIENLGQIDQLTGEIISDIDDSTTHFPITLESDINISKNKVFSCEKGCDLENQSVSKLINFFESINKNK